ncbi:PREDICTED: meiosis-specific kinetochore protein [Condylura cristata]|uniref:meiosis-specific kinetochore protein n=1 Tax=Condylura cristata TaxID=143302 RepID=UPI000643871F|nr:PREDICTED: meiosis-specific kinetochore protein [Condylura cristata]
MALWPRVYTRKKRACERLNLTPTPGLGAPAKVEVPSGPGLKGSGKVHDLARIEEKAEQSRLGGGGPGPLSTQLRVSGEKSLQENSTSEETQAGNIAPLIESVTDNLQVNSSSSNSELVSGLSWQHVLSCSVTDSYTEYRSSEERLSSFPSPELFRGADHLDWECPKLEEHMLYKNSTLLDTSKAVVIEEAAQFLNLSTILGTSSEDYQKFHRRKVMKLADQNISPKPKNTSNPESDSATCEILLAEKLYPSTSENQNKKKNINSSTPDKKSRGLLTSTPSSQTAGLVIDLSPVKKASFEELFPNISSYINSNEIVPVSSLQENSSNKVPSNPSEICCIIRASPGTRQVKSKGIVLKKKYSPPKGIPQDIIIKTSGRM